MYEIYLEHHGVKGMHWGVRRYQNKNGSLTAKGKNREKSRLSSDQKKKIARVAIGTMSVAALAIAARKNPEAVKKVISASKSIPIKKISKTVVDKGKNRVFKMLKDTKNSAKLAKKSFKEGVKEGIKEAPKKAGKTVATGAILFGTKKALDKSIGKENSDAIFKANDKDQIGKFWKTQMDNYSNKKKK